MTVLLISGTVLFAIWVVALSLTIGGIVERNTDLRGSNDVFRFERNAEKLRSKRSAMKGRRTDVETFVDAHADRSFRRSSADDSLSQQSGNLPDIMCQLRRNMVNLSTVPGSKLFVKRAR